MRPLGAASIVAAMIMLLGGLVVILEARIRPHSPRLLDVGALLVLAGLIVLFVATGVA